MSTKIKPEDVERESLKDLKILVEKSKEWQIDMAVIGGYAVRAFTNAYRHTKDIDLAIGKEEQGRFIALLKSEGYVTEKAEFGLRANKKFDSDFIAVHISVGKIEDITSGFFYPITSELFEEGKVMLVKSRYLANKEFDTDVPIVDLNTLIILKLMPKGRPEKDGIDIISLIFDQSEAIDYSDVVKKCDGAKLTYHILSQIQNFAEDVNNGKVAKTWSSVTGTTMSGVQQRDVQKFLRGFDKALRGR